MHLKLLAMLQLQSFPKAVRTFSKSDLKWEVRVCSLRRSYLNLAVKE